MAKILAKIAKSEAFVGNPSNTGDPSSWFLEFKNQTRSAGSTRQVRNLVHVLKWSKNPLLGSPIILGIPVTDP